MIRRTALFLTLILACGCVSDAPSTGTSDPELDAGTDSSADGATFDPDTDTGEEPDAEPVCECPDLPDATAVCNAAGECEYSCEDGFVACDPTEPGVCTEPSRTLESCGACDPIDCTAQMPVAVAEPGCAQEGEARCVVNACEPGWLDVDEDFANGCECPDPATFDITSTPIPLECDSFVDRIIFVEQAAGGTGTTPDDPIGSLASAIDSAQSMGRDIILVGQTSVGSEFSENLVIDARNGGLQIVGGRNPVMEWGPFGAPNTVVTGADPDLPTIQINKGSVGDVIAIHGITFEQVTPSSQGIPSITARITDTDEGGVSLSDVHIVGGPGSAGFDGSPGTPGNNGSDGVNGADEVANATGLSGGSGGVSSCGVPGGKGGDSGIPNCTPTAMPQVAMSGANGSPGGTNSTPTGGDGGSNVCTSVIPGPGINGNEGRFQDLPAIESGQPSSEDAGSFVGGTWTPARGGDGVDGANGPGGAGGGGGGSRGVIPTALGGSGGGGGSGGCAGTAGGGGSAGSDSIALLLDDSSVDLALVEITYGLGGDGGVGGNGACGGIGGEGGDGGSGVRSGGSGGFGINGSSGGGGAGGNGGASIAVGLLNGASTNNDPTIAPPPATGSSPGLGGFEGPTADISNRMQGAPATCNAFSTRAPSGEPGQFIGKHDFD